MTQGVERTSGRQSFLNRAINFLGKKTGEFLKTDKGAELAAKLTQSKLANNAKEAILATVARGVINSDSATALTNLFSRPGMEAVAGNSNILASLLTSLSVAPELATLLQNHQLQQIFEGVSKGAGAQVLDGLGNQAYREWLFDNPMPPHPSTLGVAETIEQPSENAPDGFRCLYCQHLQKEKGQCNGCGSQDGVQGIKNIANPAWSSQIATIAEWEEKAKRQRQALGIEGGDTDASKTIGAILAVTATTGGLGLAKLFSANDANVPSAQEKVRDTLKGESKHIVSEIDDYRIEGANPAQLLTSLRETAQESIDVRSQQKTKGSIIAKSITLQNNSTVEGSVICTGKCQIIGIRAHSITGDLVILGELSGFAQPQVTGKGKIYLVQDEQAGVTAKCTIKNLAVTVCTVDRAWQIAKEAGLDLE